MEGRNTMTDNGLSALAAALRRFPVPETMEELKAATERTYESDAAAILGEHGVFLPDGLPEYVAFGHVEHGYTCGVCSWGRADQPRSLADYVEHMNAEHPIGPLLEGDAG
jgi:hypothetical protein